jgi:hypothetical protein
VLSKQLKVTYVDNVKLESETRFSYLGTYTLKPLTV